MSIQEQENTLYTNKFQPIYFDKFEINNETIDVLNNLISINNLNVLFIGDIGSGKTSFLNALINEYYRGHSKHLIHDNILCINSLKEQGINYYRNDLKTFCQTCSSIKGKKKIIVLDDIDFINEQSQQVFRNCIDKYSHNVNFVSSCTSIQKVIESLQSRFFIIKVKPLERNNLKNIMHKIKNSENIDIDKDAEEFILDLCNNNAKILINYMEKFKLMNMPINVDMAQLVCTNISFLTFEKYTQHILEDNLIDAINLIYSIYDKGYSVMDILDNYFLFIKTTSVLNEDQKYVMIPLICKYITIFHNIHEDEIELSLFTNNLIECLKC